MLHANYYFMDYRNQLVLTGMVNDVGGFHPHKCKA